MSKHVEIHTDSELGDFVHCNNCDTTMLIFIGKEICPVCETYGCMQWVDESMQEATSDLLEAQGYEVEYK